ncbi:MAG: hypothetical protein JO108_33015 [Acidobacteriaceae bacterium]|nr:hypothetical protein [Acidobacteriaceae bacterium]
MTRHSVIAYAEIRAINDVKVNHYLLKPCDPPDQHRYSVLVDLLQEWEPAYQPPFKGIRVLGTAGHPNCKNSESFWRAITCRTGG